MKQNYKFPALARRLLQSEDGAVTVDWLVLTAIIAMMGLGVGYAVSSGVPSLADDIGSYLSSYSGSA